MRRCLLIFVLVALTPCALRAGERVQLSSSDEVVRVTVQQPTGTETIVQFEITAFERAAVDIDGQTYYQITCGKEGLLLNAGEPSLPRICRSVIIPDEGEMAVEVLKAEYRDFDGVPVAPSKGNLLRTQNPKDVPYGFSSVYQQTQPYPAELAALREPYILRDYRGTVVEVNAFQYLPQSQTLRVYTSITVAIREIGHAQTNVLHRAYPLTRVDPAFSRLYDAHFINHRGGSPLTYVPVLEEGELLVITHGAFAAAMQPFVSWKIQKGLKSTVVNVAAIGNTSTAIDNYIQAFYDSTLGNLAYVLLVGDATQVATPTASGGSADPTYAKVAGGDNYPDIFIGRFSAETVAQVQTQVERSVEYERDAQADATWYHMGTGIGSAEGPGDDGEYDWQHIENIRADLLNYTYTTVDQIYDPGATAAQVASALNAGRGIVDYCGHGSATSWGTTGFSNGNIAALTNENELPFIFSVACVNGQFSGMTCFAEAWLRSTRNNNPIGALATYMSSINQSWNPPMDAEDEFVDLLVAESKLTFGALCFNASCHMIDVYGGGGVDMFNTWHVFGDPSVQVRTDTPAAMAITHAGQIDVAAPIYEVSVGGVTGALCALARQDSLYGSAYTNASGQAIIPIAGLLLPGQPLVLTVTAFNHFAYIDSVDIVSGPSSLVLSAPNGGDVWYSADSQTITWASENLYETVAIEINRSYPAGAWEIVAASAPNSGNFVWSVTGPATSSARVRVRGTIHTEVGDTSDADLTIHLRDITISAPNGGEYWRVAEAYEIHWSSENITGNVNIELRRDYPIGDWQSIAPDAANTGSYLWWVTEPVSPAVRIRITSLNHELIGDESDGDFEILPPNSPPVIVHNPLHDQQPAAFVVTAIVTDDDDIPITYFHYWPVAGGSHDSLLMPTTGNPSEFAVTVGPLAVGAYDYFLKATDALAGISTTDVCSFNVGPVCGTEFGYDDGSAEASQWAGSTEFRWAVRFDPEQLPFVICLARIGISSQHPGTLHSVIRVEVLNADGPGGLPGTLVWSRDAGSIGNVIGGIPWNQDNWTHVNVRNGLGNPLLVNGSFYIAVSNPVTGKYEAFLHDTTSAPAGHSYVYDACNDVWLSEQAMDPAANPGNRMIRMSGFTLITPTVVVQRSGNDIHLMWEDLHAPAYRIYSANNPIGPFDTLEGVATGTDFLDLGAALDTPHKFYIVESATE